MPWTAIDTLVGSTELPHTHVNTLQDDCEFLYAIVTATLHPCPSVHRDSTGGFGLDNHIYNIRHRLPYLRFQVVAVTGTLEFIRLFYGGHKVWGNETPSATTESFADLTDISTWANFDGAWTTATNYDAENAGDGDIVENDSVYYKCIDDHTSGATTEPGTGVDWETVWVLIEPPLLGSWNETYFEIDYVSGTAELAINRLFEDYETGA